MVERARAFDVAALLTTTLRAGLYDELGWPALDEAVELLSHKRDIAIDEAWPALVLSTAKRAVVVGPDGILLDHEPRVPKERSGWQRTRYHYVDGQLLVAWYNKDYDWEGYWSTRPAETFLITGDTPGYPSNDQIVSLALPDGGRATGGRPLHVGDTKLPPIRGILTDGTSHWSLDRSVGNRKWTEYDPATGTHGRASLPAPLAAAVAEGGRLVPDGCELLPLLPGLERSPFGTDGTLLGRWVRVDAGTITTGSVDGTTVTVPYHNSEQLPGQFPIGALRLPGGAAPTIVACGEHMELWADGVRLGDWKTHAHGSGPAAGSPIVPPTAFWHALRPRDEAGSLALRGLTRDRVADLVAAVREDHDRALREYHEAKKALDKEAAKKLTMPMALRIEATGQRLPELTHPGLLRGVASLVRDTAGLGERLNRLGEITKKEKKAVVVPTGPEHGTDGDLNAALSGSEYGYYGGSTTPAWTVLNHITAVREALASTDRPESWTELPDRLPKPRFQWHSFLDRRAELLARALSPFTPEDQRASLLLLLDALAAGPLGTPAGTVRRVILCEPERKGKDGKRIGRTLRRGDRTLVFLDSRYNYGDKDHWDVLDHDPSGRFEAIDGFNTHEEERYTEPVSTERVTAVVTGIRAHGAVPWRPEAVPALIEDTGLGRAEASILLAGMPAGELDKDQRTLLRLKVTEARNAREQLGRISREPRLAVLAAFAPERPEDVHTLWTTGLDITAIAHAWKNGVGRVLRLSEDVAADARNMNSHAFETVLEPEKRWWITGTSTHKLDKEGRFVASDSAAVPNGNVLHSTVTALAWLAYRLPYGDPLRGQLPHVLDLLRKRLADPGLVSDLDVEYAENGPTSIRLREAAGLPENGGADPDGLVRVDDRFVLRPWYTDSEFVEVRPAGFTGADDPWFDRLIALRGTGDSSGFKAFRRILDPAFEALLRADGPPGIQQDPAYAVPELVAEVAKAHGIGEDAAVLYLQLLALPDPTDRHVARWTGWKPARLKKARAELAATDLVVEARRSRAGRTLFLPGGWNDLKNPALPLETWKDPLYTRSYDNAVVPDSPVPDLFHRAWQRIQNGDAPGFEQLVTRPTRKGRR